MSEALERLVQESREAIPRARANALRLRGEDMLLLVPGKAAFELHTAHGLPIEIQIQVCANAGAMIDLGEYWRLMEEHRERSRADSKLQGLRTAGGVI